MDARDYILKAKQDRIDNIYDSFEKGKEAPIGTVAMHGGRQMKKVGPDKWEPVSEGRKSGNKDAISNMDEGNFPQELKDISPLVSTKDMEAFLKRTGITFWENSNGKFRFPVKDKKQWHILKMMSHKFADKQYFQLK